MLGKLIYANLGYESNSFKVILEAEVKIKNNKNKEEIETLINLIKYLRATIKNKLVSKYKHETITIDIMSIHKSLFKIKKLKGIINIVKNNIPLNKYSIVLVLFRFKQFIYKYLFWVNKIEIRASLYSPKIVFLHNLSQVSWKICNSFSALQIVLKIVSL